MTVIAAQRPGAGDPKEEVVADPEAAARAICLRQLTAAPRSRAQLEATLARRNIEVEVGRRVLDRLTEVGLIDDAAFAESLVRTRHRDVGLARGALRHELSAKGVLPADAQPALDSIDDASELAAARALVAKRLRAMSTVPTDTVARRLASMLARKGYPSSVVLRVVREALDAEVPVAEGPGFSDDLG